jgi:teichuronic acid biosynthesis glycosyltransferase TuaG
VSGSELPVANAHGAISVVISTYQRPDACERALLSALEQTEPPLEVLVCDNGSSDDTEARMRAWETRDRRVRYLRTPVNSGTPGSTRNLGMECARGEWIAFLDDDDEWLPGKLAAQTAGAADADVIATNALRSGGGLYFPAAPAAWRPTRGDLLRANPIITSSVLVRRDNLMAAGGFSTDPRMRGLEDYGTWLQLADSGARFLILGEPMLRYNDAPGDRLSFDRARIQVAVARLAWSHALRRPRRLAGLRAAARHSAGIGYVLGREAYARLPGRRESARRGGSSPGGRGGA